MTLGRPLSQPKGLESISGSDPPSLNVSNEPVNPVAGLVAEWLSTAKAARKISTKALHAYEDDLARWATLLAEHGDGSALDRLTLEDLRTDRIEAALGTLGWTRLGRAQRARTIAAIDDLCNWLVQQELLAANPVAGVKATARVHTKTRRFRGASPPE